MNNIQAILVLAGVGSIVLAITLIASFRRMAAAVRALTKLGIPAAATLPLKLEELTTRIDGLTTEIKKEAAQAQAEKYSEVVFGLVIGSLAGFGFGRALEEPWRLPSPPQLLDVLSVSPPGSGASWAMFWSAVEVAVAVALVSAVYCRWLRLYHASTSPSSWARRFRCLITALIPRKLDPGKGDSGTGDSGRGATGVPADADGPTMTVPASPSPVLATRTSGS